VAISSSVLQLHGTPWLPSILTSGHIFFLCKNTSLHPDMYAHPLLLRHLPEEQDQPAATTGIVAAQRNLSLLSLGCVLIELILGNMLDSTGFSPEAGSEGADLVSDFVAAQSLVGEIHLKSSNYGTAVARCVNGDLHRRGCGLEDSDFSQEVYSGVVALLEQDMRNS
jgi:hypothetical protein